MVVDNVECCWEIEKCQYQNPVPAICGTGPWKLLSVEWCTLKADWRSGRRSFSLRYLRSCLLTTRSSSCQITDKLEIGWYDLGSAESVFFSISVICADLNINGTLPLCRDQLISRHRKGISTSTVCFSSRVGSESLAHCSSGSFFTNSTTSAGDTGVRNRQAGTDRQEPVWR